MKKLVGLLFTSGVHLWLISGASCPEASRETKLGKAAPASLPFPR